MCESTPLEVLNILNNYRAEINTDISVKLEKEKQRILIENTKSQLLISLKFYNESKEEVSRDEED
jgi:hypothetical protein